MKFNERLNKLISGKKSSTIIMVAGVAGLCLIMLSSILPSDNSKSDKTNKNNIIDENEAEDYGAETEKRLVSFLSEIAGVGEVSVLVTLDNQEEYIYAKEGKTVVSENKTEEENQYVMIGGSGNKSALIETIKAPKIDGVVIACTGGDSPIVQESIYNTVSTAFDIPVSRIYVTKLQ